MKTEYTTKVLRMRLYRISLPPPPSPSPTVCVRMQQDHTRTQTLYSPCQNSVDYGNNLNFKKKKKKDGHQADPDGATLSHLAFSGESTPNFPWEKSQLDTKVAKVVRA